MPLLKEKGHNIDLSHLVIHKANKVAGEKKVTIKLADEELKINKQEKYFVADIREAFQKKSLPTYGIFENQEVYNIFQQQISKYKDKETNFLNFTKESMKYYERILKDTTQATGAFVVFADFIFSDNNDRYILIFSINNKQGYNLNEDQLTVEQIKNLELNKLDVASMINITKWQKSIDNAEDIKTYLSFIRGKKNISAYFLNFIGCADKSNNHESSMRLLNAINKYCTEKKYDKGETETKKKIVFDYCHDSIKNKKEILLSHISVLIDSENPDNFSMFASDEKYGVGEIIKGDKNVLRSLKFIRHKGENFSIEFNNSLIGKDIIYNKDKQQLLIKHLPEDLISQLQTNG
ncbi:hypothetical protein A9P82_10655 [Arachidicoccus ginsenosidimutans]|uniref:nucleoid-associated protein n=1 Tax=Arachidicoccus sp. BS20 TaxID=1850526 RepID=UPI0007F06865|nr:nucleoid-associated protein [Arachidicoccus sp. BS20]ANI89708.1 hypothetical protein A9P82_10655 [Arachidicoccus sp. BS20]